MSDSQSWGRPCSSNQSYYDHAQAEFLSWSMFVNSCKELASCHEFHFLNQPGFLYLFAFISEIHVPFNLACWEGNKLLFQ